MTEKLENFELAFSTSSAGCRRECHCGRIFWDGYNSGYSWDDGEEDELRNNPNATALDYSVSTIMFEGKEYVCDCNCWHKRAETIIGFIDGHAREIAEYLSREKKRLQRIAEHAPVVDGSD